MPLVKLLPLRLVSLSLLLVYRRPLLPLACPVLQASLACLLPHLPPPRLLLPHLPLRLLSRTHQCNPGSNKPQPPQR